MVRRVVTVGDDFNLPQPTRVAIAQSTEIADVIEEALEGVSVDIVGATIVYHGTVAATPRPATPNAVIWVGSVYPLNAVLGDLVPDVEIPVDPPTVIFSDDYNRTDGAPGATPTGGVSLVVTGTATPTIISGQLGVSAATGTAYPTYDAGISDGVFRVKVGNRHSAAGFGIPFRFSSATNHLLLARVSSGTQNWRLIKRVGSTTAVDVFVSSVPIAANDSFEITLDGSSIAIVLNGVAFWSGTVTDHVANTRFGTMFTAADIAGATTFDNLSFTELA